MTCSGSNGNIIASPATATRSEFMIPEIQPEPYPARLVLLLLLPSQPADRSSDSTGRRQPVPKDIAFPVGFAWGAATAAYQIEEGQNADGNGPNVWDTFTHQGGDRVFKNQTGDVACGSYTLWEEDLKCIKQLGLTHYRFSLSWSRLLPDGTTGFINQKDTYNNPIIYITENGFSQSDPALLDDSQLWEYFRLILQEILKGTI
ncbi:cytosolic beta-glucosidase-like [Pterocles gutturalis]